MRKQINFALVLGVFFICWLFYNTTQNYEIQHEFNWAMQGDLSGNNIPIIYNKATGESWKFYIKSTGNNTEVGWAPLTYVVNDDVVGFTPNQAVENLKRKFQKNNPK